MAAFKDRIDRLNQLEALVSRHAGKADCPDAGRLLATMYTRYQHCANVPAQRRAIQRDLGDLVADGRIEVVNPGGKPLRYRRCSEDIRDDPYVQDFARKSIDDILRAELPGGQLQAVWQRMLEHDSGTGLEASKLRILNDSQRLLPAEIREGVLADVLEALSRGLILSIGYRDAKGVHTTRNIHPQALLQRGPRMYLFAMKNNEDATQMYALHRFTSSKLLAEPARQNENFDLDAQIKRGYADFGDGTVITLVLRAREYAANLLRDCPLHANQRVEDEDEDSDFAVKVTAEVLSTGQLLRWLLGFGNKIEVLAPDDLRHVMAAQTAKAAKLYQTGREG